ncbi:MAG: SRPBCC family protein [Pseudorhodoplanes sp.]
MTIALTILAVIAAVIIGILIYASTLPDTFRVERSAMIHAPSGTLYSILTDLRRGAEWSPFEKGLKMDKSYSGPATGVGSAMEWSNSKDVGAGKFSIVDATPSKITFNLVMLKPMKASNVVEYALTPQGDATVMTWSMYGPTTMMTKLMGLFMSMDKMCGNQFEKGLRDLKALAESEARRQPGTSRIAAA